MKRRELLATVTASMAGFGGCARGRMEQWTPSTTRTPHSEYDCPPHAFYQETPPEDQPHRNFEISDGSVEPETGTEPTNDAYIALKRRGDAATLLFIARTGTAPSQLLSDDETLFNPSEVEPGTTFDLPS